MNRFCLLALFLPAISLAAPTAEDNATVERVVNRSDVNLAAFLECERPELYSEYMSALRDVMSSYPNTDPVKARAFIRGLERRAKILSGLGIADIKDKSEENRKLYDDSCKSSLKFAHEDLLRMDDYILK